MFYSVVIPVYQVKNYLIACVESVLHQDFKDYEIILVDDGSSDGSEELCDELAEQYETVRVIHQQNGGLSDARNTGMKAAKGQYIVLLDSDDLLVENSLSKLHDEIVAHQSPDIIGHLRRTVDETGEKCDYPHKFSEWMEHATTNVEMFNCFQSMPIGCMAAWNFTVKTSFARENALYFYKGIYHEDEEWVPRLFMSNGTMLFCDVMFYEYRISRSDSITAVPKIKRLKDKLFIVKHLCKMFKDRSPEERQSIYTRCASLYFGSLCEAKDYAEQEGYDEVLSAYYRSAGILKRSTKRTHRLAFTFIRTFGIRAAIAILHRMSSDQRKMK